MSRENRNITGKLLAVSASLCDQIFVPTGSTIKLINFLKILNRINIRNNLHRLIRTIRKEVLDV